MAHLTLRRGTTFLSGSARRGTYGPAANMLHDDTAVRLLGNGLRELDRFLTVLIEEVASSLGAADHDRYAFARLRNTANKLRAVRGMMDLANPDDLWLRAVGRLRVCLHHCRGEDRRPGSRDAFQLTGCDVIERRDAGTIRRTLVLTPPALEAISHGYRRMGDELVAELGRWGTAKLDFPASCGHHNPANVACDGN